MRGEKPRTAAARQPLQGSPPRARGKGKRPAEESGQDGITPACAGKRSKRGVNLILTGDHPRVRGEKQSLSDAAGGCEGSPPRARGKVPGDDCMPDCRGITPACAGKRKKSLQSWGSARDHPRVRGEKISTICMAGVFKGSPPRARGKGAGDEPGVRPGRITPACAGKSLPPALIRSGRWDHPRVRGEKRK